MKINMTIYFMIFILGISQTSCLESTEDLQDAETKKIQTYLSSNPSMDFEKKESGLYYLEKTEGSGLQATSDTAYVFYSLQLLTGTEIESNWETGDTLIFPVGLGYLIAGFEEGISYMKEGGVSVFLVPSSLAYGSTGNYYDIPGYTPLLFEVKLLKVK